VTLLIERKKKQLIFYSSDGFKILISNQFFKVKEKDPGDQKVSIQIIINSNMTW
jgi:hypothetical protein